MLYMCFYWFNYVQVIVQMVQSQEKLSEQGFVCFFINQMFCGFVSAPNQYLLSYKLLAKTFIFSTPTLQGWL